MPLATEKSGAASERSELGDSTDPQGRIHKEPFFVSRVNRIVEHAFVKRHNRTQRRMCHLTTMPHNAFLTAITCLHRAYLHLLQLNPSGYIICSLKYSEYVS